VERSIWDHAVAGRWERVNAILEGALTVDDSGIAPWTAARTEALRTMGCTITGYAMHDLRTRAVSGDVVVVAYRAELPVRCGAESPTWQFRYMSTFRRRGTGWQLVATSITPVAPPKPEAP
jgi:predicted NUDIX family NTP pyrophosphohydrolase